MLVPQSGPGSDAVPGIPQERSGIG
jgi:hypothetical protein